MEKVLMYIISDLDGTIADISHRLHHVRGGNGGPPDWDAFFAECVNDSPIRPTIRVLRSLHRNATIHIITGRNSKVFDETRAWLKNCGVPYDRLTMRGEGDRRPDIMFKRETLKDWKLYYDNVDLVLEDRDRVVDMYRSEGFTCWQVAKGTY